VKIQRTDRLLFIWVLLAGVFGSLIGVPWTLSAHGDLNAVWLSVALEVLILIPSAAAVGVWLGKKVVLGSKLRELFLGKTWKVAAVAHRSPASDACWIDPGGGWIFCPGSDT